MNAARALVLVVASVTSVVVSLLLRYPALRRPQFRGGRAFSPVVSFAGTARLFRLLAGVTFVQQ